MKGKIDLFIISDIEHSSPRISNLVYYLPPIYNVVWISAKPSEDINPEDYPEGFIEKINLIFFERGINLFSKGKSIEKKTIKNTNSKKSIFYFKIKRLIINLILNLTIPDQYFFTIRKYLKLFKTFYNPNKKTIVISSYPYATPTIASFLIKRKFNSIKWILDYRDLWAFNHNYSFSKIRQKIDFHIERKIISKADIVITVSNENRNILIDQFDIKSKILLNGFSESIVDINFQKEFQKNFLKEQKTYLLHVGTLSPEFQHLDLLFESDILKNSNLEIHFLGRFSSILNEKIIEKKLTSKIKYIGRLNRNQSIQIQKLYDGLVYFDSRYNSGVLLLKFFEYINANRPIISIGGVKESESKLILRKLNRGIIISNKKQLDSFLVDIGKSFSTLEFNEEKNKNYSYQNRSKELRSIIDSL